MPKKRKKNRDSSLETFFGSIGERLQGDNGLQLALVAAVALLFSPFLALLVLLVGQRSMHGFGLSLGRVGKAILKGVTLAVMLLVGLAIMGSSSAVGGAFIALVSLIGLALWFRGMGGTSQQQGRPASQAASRRGYRGEWFGQERPPMRRAAYDAMKRADILPKETMLLPVDLGLIGEDAQGRAKVYRGELPANVVAVRPYVILVGADESWSTDQVRVRFDLHDGRGRLRYVYEMDPWIESGSNLVKPADYRLPIAGNAGVTLPGEWSLSVYVDDLILAEHAFGFREPPTIDEHLSADGELEVDARLVMEEVFEDEEPVSLDELMAEMGEE